MCVLPKTFDKIVIERLNWCERVCFVKTHHMVCHLTCVSPCMALTWDHTSSWPLEVTFTFRPKITTGDQPPGYHFTTIRALPVLYFWASDTDASTVTRSTPSACPAPPWSPPYSSRCGSWASCGRPSGTGRTSHWEGCCGSSSPWKVLALKGRRRKSSWRVSPPYRASVPSPCRQCPPRPCSPQLAQGLWTARSSWSASSSQHYAACRYWGWLSPSAPSPSSSTPVASSPTALWCQKHRRPFRSSSWTSCPPSRRSPRSGQVPLDLTWDEPAAFSWLSPLIFSSWFIEPTLLFESRFDMGAPLSSVGFSCSSWSRWPGLRGNSLGPREHLRRGGAGRPTNRQTLTCYVMGAGRSRCKLGRLVAYVREDVEWTKWMKLLYLDWKLGRRPVLDNRWCLHLISNTFQLMKQRMKLASRQKGGRARPGLG